MKTAPEDSANLQVTIVVTAGAVEPIPSSDSAMIMIGLLVFLGIAIVLGGAALISRRA